MKLLINGLIIASAIALGLYVTRASWNSYAKYRKDADLHTRLMDEAEATRMKQLDNANRAETSIGKEEQARRDGYLGKHEVAVGH